MKIADLNTRRDWFELVKDAHLDRTLKFLAVSEAGWEACKDKFSAAPEEFHARGPIDSVLGLPVVKVTDIPDDEIELREREPWWKTNPFSDTCTECGAPVYIHPPSRSWGCSNIECKATGSL